eukprot:122890-Pelagomonas_calceolata.AAC.1
MSTGGRWERMCHRPYAHGLTSTQTGELQHSIRVPTATQEVLQWIVSGIVELIDALGLLETAPETP